MRKFYLFSVAVIAGLFVTGCTDDSIPATSFGVNPHQDVPTVTTPTVTPPSSPLPTPAPTPTATPESVWNGYYKLPSKWHINLDYPNRATIIESNGIRTELEIALLSTFKSHQQLQEEAEFLRDAMAPCVPGGSDGVDRNCQKPTTISDQKAFGENAVLFRYYGTWMDRDQEVNSLFLNHQGQMVELTLLGSLAKYQSDLLGLLGSLKWKEELPNTGIPLEPEQLGL